MKPAEIRARVLEDHADLRVLLDAVEDLAVRARSGSRPAVERLRERGQALAFRFREHLALEDEQLMPLVKVERGDEAVAELVAEHRDQRMVIDFLLERMGDGRRPTRLLVREMATFAELLRADMAHEEEELLEVSLDESPGPGSAPRVPR